MEDLLCSMGPAGKGGTCNGWWFGQCATASQWKVHLWPSHKWNLKKTRMLRTPCTCSESPRPHLHSSRCWLWQQLHEGSGRVGGDLWLHWYPCQQCSRAVQERLGGGQTPLNSLRGSPGPTSSLTSSWSGMYVFRPFFLVDVMRILWNRSVQPHYEGA